MYSTNTTSSCSQMDMVDHVFPVLSCCSGALQEHAGDEEEGRDEGHA